MKIESGRGVAPSTSVRRGGGAAAPGFAPLVDGAAKTASTAPVNAVTPLDAILALQAEGFGPERRARQLRRGKDALDALEKLEAALLSGSAPAQLRADLESLRRASEPTGDEGLDAVLLEVDIRLAVELAKLEMAARAR